MPDSEELEKKEKREFMRETIGEAAADQKTDCEAGGSLCMRVSRIESRGGFVCGGKAVCGSVFSGKGCRRHPQSSFPKTIRTLFLPSDGADADMTAQPEQNGAGD